MLTSTYHIPRSCETAACARQGKSACGISPKRNDELVAPAEKGRAKAAGAKAAGIEVAPLELAELREVNVGPDLGNGKGRGQGAADLAPGTFDELSSQAGEVAAHGRRAGRDAAGLEGLRRGARGEELAPRQVHATGSGVFAHVPHDVRQLERRAHALRVSLGPGPRRAEDPQAQRGQGRGHRVAVGEELLARFDDPGGPRILFQRREQRLEVRARQLVAADDAGEPERARVARAAVVDRVELALPSREAGESGFAARRLVGDVVGGAREPVDVAKRIAAIPVEEEQREVQIRPASRPQLAPEAQSDSLCRARPARRASAPPRQATARDTTRALSA